MPTASTFGASSGGATTLPLLATNILDDTAWLAFFDAPTSATPTTGISIGLGLSVAKDGAANAGGSQFRGGAINLSTGATGDSQSAVQGDKSAFGDRNPRADFILTSSAANAALKVQAWGFSNSNSVSDWTTTTEHKAFFRSATTGNLFAVTGNASAEQTTDLGASHTLGEAGVFSVYTEDDGVTWKFEIAGVVVATHTTQVPGASTGMRVTAGIENNTTTTRSITNCDLIQAYQDRT